MLILETACRAVASAVQLALTHEKKEDIMLVPRTMKDFNSSEWTVVYTGEVVYVGLTMHMTQKKLVKWGMPERLEKVYGADAVVGEDDLPEDLFETAPDLCLKLVDDDRFRGELSKAQKEELQDLCNKYASLYMHAMTAVFAYHFELQNKEEQFEPVRIAYRPNEAMYLTGTRDNLALHLSMQFETEDDLLFGRLYLQEFADAKKHKRQLAAAPSCSFSKDRPKVLEGIKHVEAEDPRRLWVTMFLFTKHTDTKQPSLEKTVPLLLQFPNYVRYHISCSHAYVHGRMRSRHTGLLQVLNRAKTNQTGYVAAKIE